MDKGIKDQEGMFYFMGRCLRTDNIGFVTNMAWEPMAHMIQIELLFVDDTRKYFNPKDVELEQKGSL